MRSKSKNKNKRNSAEQRLLLTKHKCKKQAYNTLAACESQRLLKRGSDDVETPAEAN